MSSRAPEPCKPWDVGEERGPAHKLRPNEFPAPAPADSGGSGGLAGMGLDADSDEDMAGTGADDAEVEAGEAGEDNADETDDSSDEEGDVRPFEIPNRLVLCTSFRVHKEVRS